MIFIQPLTLTGEFLTHAIAIVLLGALISEYFLSRSEVGICAARRRNLILLFLVILGLGAAMIWFEFFVGRGQVWPNIFIHVPGLLLIFYLLFMFQRKINVRLPAAYFYTIILSVTAIFAASTLYIFVQNQFVIFASTVAQVTAIVAFFIYIHYFLISKPNEIQNEIQ